MNDPRPRIWSLWVLLPLLAPGVPAQISQGPDVITGDLNGIASFGAVGVVSAYSIGTTSCNIGNMPVQWQGTTANHPVIAQNFYRIRNGRFEQIGMSWLKHGYIAVTQNLCGSCQLPGTGSLLGVNCSDPYSAGLNGAQYALGPRSEVNASSGVFPYPFGGFIGPYIGTDKRLQVANVDLDPVLNPGATFLAEGQYIAADDAAAGNANNNASYRRMNVSGSGPPYTFTFNGATVRQKPAVEGWRDLDPAVQISYVDVPNDGRFVIGRKDLPLGGGFTRYDFAAFNLNSDRSGASFTVNFPSGTSYQNPYFHDVPYHTGEPYSGADWIFSAAGNGVTWQCPQTFAVNPAANALRWSSCYSFSIEADAIPAGTSIELFKPPSCPAPPTWPSSAGYLLAQGQPYDFVPLGSLAGMGNGPVLDDGSVVAALPFPFTFYGQVLSQVRISSNGYLCRTDQDGTVAVNTGIPDSLPPNGFIAGYWTDLDPGGVLLIRYGTAGSVPNRRFVVDYSNVPHGTAPGTNSFQIILNESDQSITSTVASCAQAGSNATRGVESPGGTSGTQGSANTPGSAPANSTWKYTPGIVIPTSADLVQVGTGAPNTPFGASLLSWPSSPYILAVDSSPGPFNAGSLGMLGLGFGSNLVVVRDGIGVFAPANPLDVTDQCGISETVFVVPAGGLSGFDYYAQAYVWPSGGPAPPNGAFHLSDQLHLVVP